jgi:hypothetical protein
MIFLPTPACRHYYLVIDHYKIIGGETLGDTVFNDGPDPDQFIESGQEYDVTLALRNSFTLEPGESTIYATRTFFGSGPPSAVNFPPVAESQEVDMLEDDKPLKITLKGSDPEGASLSFEVVDPPLNGTLTLSALKFRKRSWAQGALKVEEAVYTYTPDPDFNGTDSFTFKVNDGEFDSAPATVSITVVPVIDLSNLAFEQREAGDEEGGIAFSTPGIAALVDYDHTNDSGVSAQQLEVVTKAQNVPNECKEKLDPSDIATEKFSVEELPDPVFGSVSFKVWEVGPQAMEAAAQHGCTSVTLQMADFKVTGVDDAEVKSQPLSGEFSITATVEQTEGQSKKGSLRAKGKSRARLTPPTSSRSKKSR